MKAIVSLVERYYGVLDAPHKQLFWFEQSGHDPLYEESGKLVDLMLNRVLARTQPAW